MEWAGSSQDVWKIQWEGPQGSGWESSEHPGVRSWERVKTRDKPLLFLMLPNTTLPGSNVAAGTVE